MHHLIQRVRPLDPLASFDTARPLSGRISGNVSSTTGSEVNILYTFAYVFAMFDASPAPIMEAAVGRLHDGGRAAFGRPPTVVETFMGCGEAANTAKTYAHMHQISPYLYMLYFSHMHMYRAIYGPI